MSDVTTFFLEFLEVDLLLHQGSSFTEKFRMMWWNFKDLDNMNCDIRRPIALQGWGLVSGKSEICILLKLTYGGTVGGGFL